MALRCDEGSCARERSRCTVPRRRSCALGEARAWRGTRRPASPGQFL